MLNLLVKDFKLMYSRETKLSKKILSTLMKIIFIGCFIAIETFFFIAILKKIKSFNQAPLAFMTLFLFIISIILMIMNIFQAMKLFFNKKDIEQLSNYPVTNAQIIFSKLIFLFLNHFVTSLIFVFPLFISYGVLMNSSMLFFYIALFYPVFSFFIEVGIALLLVYPIWLAIQYLKKHPILQFIVSISILFIGVFLYSQVLNIFVELVANNELSSLFSKDSIEGFINFRKFLVPVNFLTDAFISKRWARLLPFTLIALGVFALGLIITVNAFNYVRNITFSINAKVVEKEYKQMSQTKALIKKEIILLTKSSDYVFSFSGLLIVQPFLAYLVISALNTIFNTGSFVYFNLVVPNFLPLINVLVIMMFTLIISQGANQYIQMEKKTIKIIKTIPINPVKQLLIKMLIPCVLSFVSLVITLLVLLISGQISFMTFIFAFILTTVLLVIFDIISLREELHIRHNIPRKTTLSSLYSYLLPFLYIGVALILAILKVHVIVGYLGGIIIFVLLGLPHFLYVKKNISSLFLDLEAVN